MECVLFLDENKTTPTFNYYLKSVKIAEKKSKTTTITLKLKQKTLISSLFKQN